MNEFSVDDATISDLLAAVAKGKPLRLVQKGQEVATVSPPASKAEEPASLDCQPFGEWIEEWRTKYEIEQYGFTKEEVDSWRDRSPPPEPIDFG